MFLIITLWIYENYESGTQNSENTILRLQDSYFLSKFLVIDRQKKKGRSEVRIRAHSSNCNYGI
jgi:hypothetical protein